MTTWEATQAENEADGREQQMNEVCPDCGRPVGEHYSSRVDSRGRRVWEPCETR
jgi:hypothetical protein